MGERDQLSSAVEALQTLGIADQPVVGLAKRLEEVFLPGLSQRAEYSQNVFVLEVVAMLRDESHRFAIAYHRKLRQKRTLTSELDDIPGVGPSRRKGVVETLWFCSSACARRQSRMWHR